MKADDNKLVKDLATLAKELEKIEKVSDQTILDKGKPVHDINKNSSFSPYVRKNREDARHDAREKSMVSGKPVDETGVPEMELEEAPDKIVDIQVERIFKNIFNLF